MFESLKKIKETTKYQQANLLCNPSQDIKYLWIIQKDSSQYLFYHEFFEDKPLDGILISGLLSALNIFSEEKIGPQGINNIEMGDLQWIYTPDSSLNLLIIAACDKECNSTVMQERLSVIQKMFITTFGINKDFWDDWDGNTSKFSSFNEIVTTLQAQWAKANEMMNVGVIFDLLGIYQEILYLMIKIINENFGALMHEEILRNIHGYKKKIEQWLKTEAIFDRYRIIDLFLPQIDLKNGKINFNQTDGTKVLGLNPIGLDSNVLTPIFMIVIKHFKKVIKSVAGENVWLKIIQKYLRPYLFSKWEVLEQYNLTREILEIILN